MNAFGVSLMFLVAGCSPAKREAQPPVVISPAEPEPVDAAPVATEAAAPTNACPASFATGGGLCTPAGKTCEYPEGTCRCAGQSYCGGAAPPPELLKRLAVPRWTCTPSPKTLGPDGCPVVMPNGGACSTPGKQCHYTPCCAFTVTCTGGKWVSDAGSCPP